MAIFIKVATLDGKKASRGLAMMYGSTVSDFPLEIRMRLVSEFREVKGNSIMMGKHTRLRVRQASVLSMMIGQPSDEIMQLEYAPKRGAPILITMIMGINSSNPATPGNLVHALEKYWKFFWSKQADLC